MRRRNVTCLFGRHRWTPTVRFARPVEICTECRKLRIGRTR